MRLNYLRENKKGLYTALKMKNELSKHLLEIQDLATSRIEQIMKEMMEKEKVTEELKEKNQMKWLQLMNNLKMSAEEIVIQELIYN